MTDRSITNADGIDGLRFTNDGLIPVVAQDAETGAVLMVAWADREALERTLTTGEVHFWSRSRGQLWKKGETSGNVLTLVSLHGDCDGDTILAVVRPAGPACHTGEATCFGAGAGRHERREPKGEGVSDDSTPLDALHRLDAVLRSRADERPEGSYTTRLLDDENLRLKKLGEETAELVTALAQKSGDRAVEEAADLVYHLLVALRAEGIGLDDVRAALEDRAK